MNTTRQLRGRAGQVRTALAWGALLLPALLAAGAAMAARSISTTSNLGFGRFVAAGGGAVSVGIGGARSRTGSVILLPSSAAAAAFRIIGNDNKTTILTLPANGAVSMVSGTSQMPLINFVSSLPGAGVIPSGQQNVTVGATLQVAPNQPPGNYSGAFQAIIEYQ